MSQPVDPRRCVLVLPRGMGAQAAPASLLSGLLERELEVVSVEDEPSAMVELAREPTQLLVVVSPGSLPRIGELIGAVRTYYPRVVCWRYDQPDVGRAVLREINGTCDDLHASPTGEHDAERVLDGTRQRIDPLLTRIQGPPPGSGPLVSEEELAMLLGEA